MMKEKAMVTPQDLTVMIQVIDVCVERGAFKGAEILSIGQLREKLVSALEVSVDEAKKE